MYGHLNVKVGPVSSVALLTDWSPLRGENLGIEFVKIHFSSLNENIGWEISSGCCS